MTAARPCVLSAKVPLDLRQSVEALAQREGHGEVSIIIRRACRELVDRELARQAGGNLLDGPGTARRRAVGPEAQAALRVASRAGTARRLALEEFERVGASGLTADEVWHLLRPHPQNSIARRVTDLLQGGLVAELEWPAETSDLIYTPAGARRRAHRHEERIDTPNGPGVGRLTAAGSIATVYAITPAGARALEDRRAKERSAAR
jgi:hypothetical protein